jgi:bacteriocin biosynthesis cyclodehydratase domain-containing protein
MPRRFERPLLPSHFYVWTEPPDSAGDEVLRFVSERRRVKLKGHSFREFEQRVIPLLDGRHTIEEIEQAVADVFAPADLAAGLDLLAEQKLLIDAAAESLPTGIAEPLAPQLAMLHELDQDPARVQERLLRSTVTLVGVGGVGAAAAAALGAARVGTIRCFDAEPVLTTDVYFSPIFSPAAIGSSRAETVAGHVRERVPEVRVTAHPDKLETEEQIRAAIEGSDLVISTLDPAQSALVYRLNRACLAAGIRWISAALSGSEIVIGPTVLPFETACYLCYKMRAVSCAGNPEEGFAFEQYLDRRKHDDSGRRENLVFGAGIAANLLATEAFKLIAGLRPIATLGRIVIIDLLTLNATHHVILRKPWCPACFRADDAASGGAGSSADGGHGGP